MCLDRYGVYVFHQEAIGKFVSELKAEGVFAKEVRSAGVAFHSYYMASIAPNLLAALKKVKKRNFTPVPPNSTFYFMLFLQNPLLVIVDFIYLL